MATAYEHQTELALRAEDDAGALAELIAEMDKPLWGLLRKGMSDRSIMDMQDVYQEIMLALYQSIGNFKGKSKFYTWFRRLALNKIVDYYRRDGRNRAFLMTEAFDIDNYPASEPESSWIYDDLLSKLPLQYGEILRKMYYFGVTYSEIARDEGITYEAIRSRRCRALEYIRTSFTENELR